MKMTAEQLIAEGFVDVAYVTQDGLRIVRWIHRTEDRTAWRYPDGAVVIDLPDGARGEASGAA
jgi:hypothetical protein